MLPPKPFLMLLIYTYLFSAEGNFDLFFRLLVGKVTSMISGPDSVTLRKVFTAIKHMRELITDVF